MKLIALLSWFDENPSWLAATVTSLRFCDHLVAVDGAYAAFPNARASSGTEQAEVVVEVAQSLGLGLTLHVPQEPWAGDEVEKRSAMFELGRAVATTDEDWFVCIDADMTVRYAPDDLRDRLDGVYNVAQTMLVDPFGADIEPLAEIVSLPAEGQEYHRHLFRNLPELRVEGTHYTYLAEVFGETVLLRGEHSGLDEQTPVTLGDMVVEHRRRRRTRARLEAAERYATRRSEVVL